MRWSLRESSSEMKDNLNILYWAPCSPVNFRYIFYNISTPFSLGKFLSSFGLGSPVYSFCCVCAAGDQTWSLVPRALAPESPLPSCTAYPSIFNGQPWRLLWQQVLDAQLMLIACFIRLVPRAVSPNALPEEGSKETPLVCFSLSVWMLGKHGRPLMMALASVGWVGTDHVVGFHVCVFLLRIRQRQVPHSLPLTFPSHPPPCSLFCLEEGTLTVFPS